MQAQGTHLGQPVELPEHLLVVAARGRVDREHARRVAHAQHALPREAPVHVAGERREVRDAARVLLAGEDRLVEVGNAPALGNVEAEELGQLAGGLQGRGVAPGAERNEQLVPRVERQVAVHHRRDAQRAHAAQRHAVALADVGLERGVAGGEAGEDLVVAVGPVAVDQRVLPVEGADGNGLVAPSVQHRLDARRSELDAQRGGTGLDLRGNLFRGLSHECSLVWQGVPAGFPVRATRARSPRRHAAFRGTVRAGTVLAV